MVNGVNGLPGRLVLKPAVVEKQQERECAIILLLLEVDQIVLVAQNRPKNAIPELVLQAI